MKSDQGVKNEQQMIDYGVRMRRERDEAQAALARSQAALQEIADFLNTVDTVTNEALQAGVVENIERIARAAIKDGEA